MATTNKLLALLRDGHSAVGGWCHLADSMAAEITGRLDVDYLVIDMQHGTASQSGIISMLQAVSGTGTTPLVRIPHQDYGLAQRLLDAGAEGLIVPLVNHRADAEAAASAVRYPPLGNRSFGPVRSQMVLGRDTEHVNSQILCLVQIETREAMGNLDEIVNAPGIDGVYVGPADLALTHGLSITRQEPELDRLFDLVLEACSRANSIPGIHCFSGESAKRAQNQGFRLTSVGSDAVWLKAGYCEQLALARGTEHQAPGGYY